MLNVLSDINSTSILLYYLCVLISLLYLFYKYKSHPLLIFITLLFFNGLFAYYGKGIQNNYKIIITLISFSIFIYYKLYNNRKTSIHATFFFFLVVFFYTTIHNNDGWSIILSQFSRYLVLYITTLLFLKFKTNTSFKKTITKLVFDLIYLQIVLSFIKLILIGPTESIVGSSAYTGGAVATTIPIIGFVCIWLNKNGRLEKKDWLLTLGLIFIGFMSFKRAIWFIMPLIIFLFMFYVPQKKIPNRLVFLFSLLIPLIFYFGVRLNPTLNPEKKTWGSFDLNYTITYAKKYSFGEDNNKSKINYGRGSATQSVIKNLINGDISEKNFLGHGLRFMYATDYDEFADLGFDIDSKGSATGLFQNMITNGYLGIFATLLFSFSILSITKNKRLKYVLYIVFVWEYFFYTGSLLREQLLSTLLVYIVIFSETIKFDVNKIKLLNNNYNRIRNSNLTKIDA